MPLYDLWRAITLPHVSLRHGDKPPNFCSGLFLYPQSFTPSYSQYNYKNIKEPYKYLDRRRPLMKLTMLRRDSQKLLEKQK